MKQIHLFEDKFSSWLPMPSKNDNQSECRIDPGPHRFFKRHKGF